jgi:hypothetical protein
MSEQHLSVAAAVAAIEASFGHHWGVWLSDTGWWWAARTQALTAEQRGAGGLPYLHADNPDELTELIRQQERTCPTDPTPPPDHTAGHETPKIKRPNNDR